MQKIKEKTDIPVVLIDYPYENFTMIPTDDREAFSRIAKHILDTHKCDPDKVYFLTGMKDYDVSEKRLGGFLDIYNERGLKVDESHIFYGDFWYGGSEAVADKISSGEVPMPQAVVCASCGCRENYNYLRSRLSGSLYSINHNYRNGKLADDEIDIGILLESYMLENLTSAENYGDGLNKILSQTYLLAPFDKFYLCLILITI